MLFDFGKAARNFLLFSDELSGNFRATHVIFTYKRGVIREGKTRGG